MNKYDVIGIVGEGAYGVVYKAKNKDTGEYGIIIKLQSPSKSLKKLTKMNSLKKQPHAKSKYYACSSMITSYNLKKHSKGIHLSEKDTSS